jgi:DNA-binding transcriptional LysR family regulator
MNLNHLAIFHAVAQAGGMTRGPSAWTSAKQVRELERVLGVHLFDRIGRRVHLSQAGEILVDYATQLFALAHEAERAMADVSSVERRRLVIGASTTICTYLLPGVLAEFWRRHPNIELLVEIANTEQVRRRLAGHELSH